MSAERNVAAEFRAVPGAGDAHRLVSLVLTVAIAGCVVVSAGLLAVGRTALIPTGLLLLSAGLVFTGALWRVPIRFVYFLLGTSLVIEQWPIAGLNPITTQTHFFQGLSGAFHIPVPIQPSEIVMAIGLAAVLLPRLAQRGAPSTFFRGALYRPMMYFAAAVVGALVYGASSSKGDAFNVNVAWAEARSFLYLVICYVLAANLVVNRARLRTFVWVLIVALSAKGLQGIDNYVTEKQLHEHLEAITGHEDVVFFGCFFVLLVAFKIFGGDRRQLKVMLLFSLPVLFTELATGRRIAFFVLGAAFAVLGASLLKINRRRFFRIAPVVLLLLGAYTAIFWNHPNGMLGQPIRAFRSQIGYADARDQASDQWRVLERYNIRMNIRSAPITGLGFGHQYTFYVSEPSLTGDGTDSSASTGFVYWTYITHCAIFWVWMKMGILGYLAFWYLLGSAIVFGLISVRTMRDGYLRAVAITAVGLVVMQIMFSYGDLGLTYSRNMIFLGLVLGVLARLPTIERAEQTELRAGDERPIDSEVRPLPDKHDPARRTRPVPSAARQPAGAP